MVISLCGDFKGVREGEFIRPGLACAILAVLFDPVAEKENHAFAVKAWLS